MKRLSAFSAIGMRENIEDACGSARLVYRGATGNSELAIYVVADGVGGSKGGEQASLIAIETCTIDLPRFLCRQTTEPIPDVATAIDKAVELANVRILKQGQRTGLDRMATTLVLVVVIEGRAHVAWLGDSPAYLLRNDQLYPLTRDHSVVREMLDAGDLSPDEAVCHPKRHAITRCLGRSEAAAEHITQPLCGGDVVLLSTDGLFEPLSENEVLGKMQDHYAGEFSFSELAERLVRSAVDRGATDNVTALCAEIDAVPLAYAPDEQATVTESYFEQLASVEAGCE